jgi:hypothetical protein
MIFYRQFIERRDFEVLVLTDRSDISKPPLPNWIAVEPPRIIKRLQQTRLSRYAQAFALLTAGNWIPRGILKALRDFRADLVYLGPDTAIADLGIAIARKLNVPIAGHFMDWPTFTMNGPDWLMKFVERRYRARYAACDLAFGICPEMLEALGPHRNSAVFYPIGNLPLEPPSSKPLPEGRPFRLLFAGNLGQWYGRMVLELAKKVVCHPDFQLVVAGKCANWTLEEEKWMVASGMYVGFLKGAEYDALFAAADGLLVCNGFTDEAQTIEATNFKSKFVDYLASGLPIFIWAPEGSSSASFSKREGVGILISDTSPEAVEFAIANYLKSADEEPIFTQTKWMRLRSFFDTAEVLPGVCRNIYQLIDNNLKSVETC